MGKSNREIRIALARTFGSGCMFRKSNAEEFIEKLGTIKTYKRFKEEKRYTFKKIRKLETFMTLHHLVHKSENGSTSEANGAIINELAHRYIHSLPRNQEEIINDYIREWKKMYSIEVPVVEVDSLGLGFNVNTYVLDTEKLKYNRSKVKKETEDIIKEYEREV